ncbi:MAG: hypothetical protein WAM92_03655, partial [Mycobacterium sp.]
GLRSRIQQARVDLAYLARSRCVSLRGELAEDTATVGRRGIAAFEEYVATRVCEVAAEIDDGVRAQLADLAAEFGLTAPADGPPPQLPTVVRPLLRADMESRLTVLFGAVLGTGVALTFSRLFADVLRAYTTAGAAVGGAVGLTVAVWVVGVRRTLRDHTVLDRWVGDVINELRPALEQHVATRVLHADSALTGQLMGRYEAASATAAVRVAEIDDELRGHARRGSQLPSLQSALAAVNGELNRSCE